MNFASSASNMIKKFDCLVDKDEALISWSSSDTEDSAYTEYARNLEKKNHKRKSTNNRRLPSAKLRIREIEQTKTTSKNVNEHSVNDELSQSPVFCCTSSVKSNQTRLKEESLLSPILKCHNLNSAEKHLGQNNITHFRHIICDGDLCNDCVSPILNMRNELIPSGQSDLKAVKISSPLTTKYSNPYEFSTNSGISPILNCTQNFNRENSYYPKSPVLRAFNTMMDKVNISPLLNRTIKINSNINNAKKKLDFSETTSLKFKNEFDITSRTSPVLFDNWNNSKQPVDNIPTHDHKQLFKKFSFKSQPFSQQTIDNNSTPEIVDDTEINLSQATIRSFTPTNEDVKSTHSKEIITGSSPSVVELKLENDNIDPENSLNLLLNSAKLRKRRLKRDGLAHRLQNALKSRKSAVAIWKHEMFLAANSNFDMPLSGDPLNLKVLEGSRQYGVLVLNCLQTAEDVGYILVLNKCLVNCEAFERGQIITIFKPYDIIQILESDRVVNVILNASKIKS